MAEVLECLGPAYRPEQQAAEAVLKYRTITNILGKSSCAPPQAPSIVEKCNIDTWRIPQVN
jgi:hypothetical protein